MLSRARQRGSIRHAWQRASVRTEFRVKLIVFGASRGVGRSLTELALADGHRVTAVVRNPSTVELNHESLEVVAADVTDADSVRRCLPGHEVAFCTVGADERGATTLYSTAARNIASAMDDQGVRRLVFLSNFGVLGEKGSGARTAAVVFIAKLMLRPTLEDHRRHSTSYGSTTGSGSQSARCGLPTGLGPVTTGRPGRASEGRYAHLASRPGRLHAEAGHQQRIRPPGSSDRVLERFAEVARTGAP